MTAAAPSPAARRVLVADDVEAVRVWLTLALEEAGFAVTASGPSSKRSFFTFLS